MDREKSYINEYLLFCAEHKRLSEKTIKAYRLDLMQFYNLVAVAENSERNKEKMTDFLVGLHKRCKPKTVKRKIATLKAYEKFLIEYKNIDSNMFYKVNTKFKDKKLLPKIIPVHELKNLFLSMYEEKNKPVDQLRKLYLIRDIAVLEFLIGTGIRVSELCSLKKQDVDLLSKSVKIYGKGSKERIISIDNKNLLKILLEYDRNKSKKENNSFFFLNNSGNRLSEQSVRLMIKKHCCVARIELHITPHMFRHTFATLLLEQDVDIRYIQKILGHSSITVTEIYTYVSISKQREILSTKNPRNLI